MICFTFFSTYAQEILQVQTKNMPLTPDVSFEFLSMITEGYTGADLMDLCRNAAVETIKHNREVFLPTYSLEPLLPARLIFSNKVVNSQDFMVALKMTSPSVPKGSAKHWEQWRLY